jgi:hypothetical protein
MELVLTPEPTPEEREAVAAAFERLLAGADVPAAYRSGWRKAGILENVDGEAPGTPASAKPS